MILLAEKADADQLIQLWEKAFGEDKLVRWFYEQTFEEITIFTVQEQDRVISMLHYIPCSVRQDGMEYKGAYLYALATAEQYRGQGYMQRLIEAAQEHAQRNADRFLFLVPAGEGLYGYYEKMGFGQRLYREDACNVFFSPIMEMYVKEEIAAYGQEEPMPGESCGAVWFPDANPLFDKVNGLIPF